MLTNVVYELQRIFELIIIQFRQIFPYWILGVLAGSLLSVYALEKIEKLIGNLNKEGFSILKITLAAMLGVASPICMYGTVPLIVSLAKRGLPEYIMAAFMISSILLNPNLLLMSVSLGMPIALFRLFSAVAAGVLAGILVKIFFRKRSLFRLTENEGSGMVSRKRKKLLNDIHKSITITAPYLLAGILLTALFDRYFPKGYIVAAFGQNRGLGILFAVSMGVPIYACGGGSIPLLKLWLHEGMTVGSAIAFMLSGAATKFTNLGAVKIILGLRNFIIYIVFNILFSICAGLLANAIL